MGLLFQRKSNNKTADEKKEDPSAPSAPPADQSTTTIDGNNNNNNKKELTPKQLKVLARMEKVARFMDLAIPIPFLCCCKNLWRVGVDSILGFFFPVLGDAIGGIVSVIILIRIVWVFEKQLLYRKWGPLLLNIGIDLGLGCIPLVGWIFDDAWNCNMKNINIVREHYGMEELEW